jgi:hypothetical protein
MTTIERVGAGFPPAWGLLDRDRIIAEADFNRRLVPPAALCIHLCIGMAYGFSVFWILLSHAIGVDKSCSREGVEPSGPLQKVSDNILVPCFWIYPAPASRVRCKISPASY